MRTLGKRMYKKVENDGPIDITVSDEVVTMKVSRGEQRVEWDSILFAVISGSMVLLYPSKTSFYIFPKSDFISNDFESFTELVRNKVSTIK